MVDDMRVGLLKPLALLLGASLASAVAVAIASAQSGPGGGYVVIFTGSKEYHWPSCPLVQTSPGVTVLLRAQANGKGYKPHKECDPANALPATGTAPDSAGGGATSSGRNAGPIHVYVAKSDNGRYHRADCKVLPKDAKKVVLDRGAVRGRWPCTVCRPPIRATGTRAPR